MSGWMHSPDDEAKIANAALIAAKAFDRLVAVIEKFAAEAQRKGKL